MRITTDIDYKNHVFEIPELSKIHGEPTTATLLDLRNEVRVNAQSVTTDLGGGQHGHLGLVMNEASYQALPNTAPYERPLNPGGFTLSSDDLTDNQRAQEKADWEEDLRLWREVEAVERALTQQIVRAVEPKYLKALRNPATTKIQTDVKGILNYLFNNYGKVPPAILKQMKRKVEDFELDPNDPMDLLFAEIDELADIYVLQRNEMSEKQLIEIAYVIIERAKVFKKDLRDWNKKDENDKSWVNFKNHFREAQQELRNSGDLTIEQAMNKNDIVNAVTDSINSVMQVNQEQENESLQAINATIIKEKEDMRKKLELMEKKMNDMMMMPMQPQLMWGNGSLPMMQSHNQQPMMSYMPNNNAFNSNMAYGSNQGRRNQRNRNNRYCWTHGACNHWGRNCHNKAPNHKDEATFRNTMGGNTNGVRGA